MTMVRAGREMKKIIGEMNFELAGYSVLVRQIE
jgi:hypothetical protein